MRDKAKQTWLVTHQGKHNEGCGKASVTREGKAGAAREQHDRKGTPSVVKLTWKGK